MSVNDAAPLIDAHISRLPEGCDLNLTFDTPVAGSFQGRGTRV